MRLRILLGTGVLIVGLALYGLAVTQIAFALLANHGMAQLALRDPPQMRFRPLTIHAPIVHPETTQSAARTGARARNVSNTRYGRRADPPADRIM